MRRFVIPTLGVLLFFLCAVFISGCSKKEAQPAGNPRLEKSGQSLVAEPIVPVARDSSETVVAEGEELEAANEPAPEPDLAPVLSRAELAELVRLGYDNTIENFNTTQILLSNVVWDIEQGCICTLG